MDAKKAMDRVLTSMRGSRSVKDFTEEQRGYPSGAHNYELLQECGRGVSATVYKAICKPYKEVVAVKLLDLESMSCVMDEVIREAQTMRLHHHPNVLSLYTTFLEGQHLWFVMPYIRGGSILNIMKYRYKDGLDELVIAIVMKEVLKALEYVHKGDAIHRDVKAGNILVDEDGSVKLADFGVASTIERGGSWGSMSSTRNTFVGTPCWMAPEVMEQRGYNSKADIWSFGITLLELAHGHAPFAKYPPIKVMMMTVQNPPPQLEEVSGHREFGKPVRELVANCLQKDPALRPTATQLLESRFFKNLPDTKYLLTHLLQELPQLTDRVHQTKDGSVCNPAQETMKAKEDYVKGMSGWDFTGIDIHGSEPSFSGENGTRVPRNMVPPQSFVASPRQSDMTEGGHSAPNCDTALENSVSFEQPCSPDSSTSPSHRSNQLNPSRSVERNGMFKKTASFKSRFTITHPENGKAVERQKISPNGRISEPGAPSVKSDDGQGEDDESKKIGRFDVEFTKVSNPDRKTQKAGNALGIDQSKSPSGKATSFVPPAPVLQKSIAVVLENAVQQQAELQRIMDALKDADRGKVQTLQNLLSRSTKKEDRVAELEKRVKELEAENSLLREQNGNLVSTLGPGGYMNGPGMTGEDS